MNKNILGIIVIGILLILNLINSIVGTGPIMISEISNIESKYLIIFSGLIIPLFSLLIVYFAFKKKRTRFTLIALFLILIICVLNAYWLLLYE